MPYTLKADGDDMEKVACGLFLDAKLPSYEKFWQKFVAPLTGRPRDIQFKTDPELQKDYPSETLEGIHERLCIAQLHYSALNFLKAAYDGKRAADKAFDGIEKCFSSLYSVLDISAELFGRFGRLKNNTPITIDAFDPVSTKDAMRVRRQWQRANPYPADVQSVRDYRDILIHGRMMFYFITPAAGYIGLPKMGREREYFDWRKSLTAFQTGSSATDFAWSSDLTEQAFDAVIEYLETKWKDTLL